jgi:futalosine hydrolase
MECDTLFPNRELSGATIQLCGLGPIVAAARTTHLIARHQPKKILLVGIAGGFTDEFQIGSACVFRRVACYGIGVGSGHDFQSAEELGWPQWLNNELRIGDEIELLIPKTIKSVAPLLLSVCSASAGSDDARMRLQKFSATAEDMEGFAVATACQLAGIRLTIVRGISNRVGNRNHRDWKIDDALSSARESVLRIIGESTT